MGRTFQEGVSAHVSSVFHSTRHFGEAITYHSVAAGAFPINTVKIEEAGGPEDEKQLRANQRVAEFRVSDSAIPWPSDGDRIETTEANAPLVWKFRKIIAKAGGEWRLQFTTTKIVTKGFAAPNSM